MSCNLPCYGMQNSKINTQVVWKSNSIIKPFYSAFHNSIECVVPENIHTPTTEDHWKFQRGGRVKGQQFPRGRGVSWETTFPKGHEPRTKHESNIQSIWSTKTYLQCTYVLLKQKSVLLAIEIKLTLLASIYKFKTFKMAVSTGVSSPDFQLCIVYVRPTLPFTWVSLFATFTYSKLIFDRIHVVLGVVTHRKCNETQVPNISMLAYNIFFFCGWHLDHGQEPEVKFSLLWVEDHGLGKFLKF